MKNLDKNQKIGLIACMMFVLFLIIFFILSNLAQSQIIPDFTPNQRIQGVLAFVMLLPLCFAMFFWGKHFQSNNSKKGTILLFVSVALFIFGLVQALLSILGVYGL